MHILTFDIEDWYLSYHSSQIPDSKWESLPYRTERNTEIILQFLDDNHLRATFFFLGYEIRKNPNLLRKVYLANHEIGFHGMYHVPPEHSGRIKFAQELKEGLSLMEDLVGEKVIFFRSPGFSWNANCPWFPEVLLEAGIKVSSSIVAGRTLGSLKVPKHPFTFSLNGFSLVEFPLSLYQLISGGIRYSGSGYFRFYPWSFLQKAFSQGEYHILYFHPRDFDTEIPWTDELPLYRNLMNRWGNASTLQKLQRLVNHYPLISLGEAYNLWKGNYA
ncbi:MAG: DUF3473 domain-containing protein [Bacteroidales bacterium]